MIGKINDLGLDPVGVKFAHGGFYEKNIVFFFGFIFFHFFSVISLRQNHSL
jgi:hypothetical protein